MIRIATVFMVVLVLAFMGVAYGFELGMAGCTDTQPAPLPGVHSERVVYE